MEAAVTGLGVAACNSSPVLKGPYIVLYIQPFPLKFGQYR